MKYIICQKPGQLTIEEKKLPQVEKDRALVRIKKVGICGTDLHAYGGNQAYFTYPRILGHELSGEILEINDNPHGLKTCDPVLVMPYVSCGKCVACRNGKTNCCTNISVIGVHEDGGMQEVLSIPISLLISAEGLALEEAAIVEPLAIGAHALRRAQIMEGEDILVMGCGPIGIGIMKQAQNLGANVIAMDINEDRLDYTRRKMGIKNVIQSGSHASEHLKSITNGDFCPAVFDATGNQKALESGISFMSHGGRYVLVGLSKGDLTFHHPSIHAKESTIMCSRNATREDFQKVIEYLKSGHFPVHEYITHKIHYSEILGHFDQWTKPESGVMKAMIEF